MNETVSLWHLLSAEEMRMDKGYANIDTCDIAKKLCIDLKIHITGLN